MLWLRRTYLRVQAFFRKDQLKGQPAEDARYAALRSFGGVEQIKEESRDVRRSRWIETLGQDVRFGLRILRKNPGITAVIVLTLALGIGANTAIFSVINAVLLPPLPYKDADRLVALWSTSLQGDAGVSLAEFADWRDQNQVFSQLVFSQLAFWSLHEPLVLTSPGGAEEISATAVTAGFFPLLGVRPVIGRTFLPEEEKPKSSLVAVLSHSLWQRRFQANPNIVDQPLKMSDEVYTVVGVLPADFRFFGGSVDLWTCLGNLETVHWSYRWNRVGTVIAQLKPGVTLKGVQAGMDTITARLEKQYPKSNAGWKAAVMPLREVLVHDLRPTLLALFVAVGFVLFIACANVANLLLTRAVARQREIIVRMALGASRLRLMRQFLTESLLLSGLGGIVGLLIGAWFVRTISLFLPQELTAQYRSLDLNKFRIDGLVFGFTLIASLLTGVIFGLAPAIHASKSKLTEGLKEGRSATRGSHHHRLLNLFVVSELSLSLVLLVGAGLMLKNLFVLQRANLGFDPKNVLTMGFFLNPSKYTQPQRENFSRQLIDRIKALPGVKSIGMTIPAPLPGPGRPTNFVIEGLPEPTPADVPGALNCYADTRFFAALGIPLLKGRGFTEADRREGSPPVIIISASMARCFWANEEPLGKRIKIMGRGTSPQWMSIVGVVGDIRHELASEGGPTMYRPLGSSSAFASLVVKVAPGKLSLANALRKMVQEMDKEQPVPSVLSVEEIISQSLWESRFILSLVGIFALVALLLATIGVYGVMSYRVSERRHEIGIRMALGAQSGDLMKLLMGQGLKLVLAGVGIGVIMALGITRFIRSLLPGVTPTDPATFTWVSLSLAAVALVAIYFSSRKVTTVDPMVALRHE